MNYFIDTVRALATTLKNAFRKPVTVEYPTVVRPRTERYRASFALPDDEHGEVACIGCLACERICPSRVIKMKPTGKRDSPVTGKKRNYVDEFVLDLSACIQCELCVQVCNSDAIFMIREAEIPSFSREGLILDLVRLRANSHEKKASWGRGTTLQEMQEPPKVEKVVKKPVATTAAAAPAAAPPVTAVPAPAPATAPAAAPPAPPLAPSVAEPASPPAPVATAASTESLESAKERA